MSAVSAEENITLDDGADLTSDYMELESNQGYDENVSENSIIEEDNVSDDDENISESVDLVIYPVVEINSAYSSHVAGNSFNGDFAAHKSSSCPHYSKSNDADVAVNERSMYGMFSNFQLSAGMGFEDLLSNINTEDFSEKAYSSCKDYFDYLKWDSLKNFIEENKIGDVFNSNIHIDFQTFGDVFNSNIHIDFQTFDYLKYDLINFMDAGMKYVDFNIANLVDINAFFDIFNKIMNSPSTHDVMANISVSNNNPTLRNNKFNSDYSDYSFYQDIDSIINFYDLNDDEIELFIGSDSNISDMLVVLDNITLINETFDLNTMPDVCIYSYEDMGFDLQLSDDESCWRDAYNNCDETFEMQSFRFSQPINCLPSNISEDIQHTFYHMIGCECTNTSFTKQYTSYDSLPEVSEFDTITSTEQEDNHDNVLFKKYNVNAPFIVDNTSVFALFGVIKITIP